MIKNEDAYYNGYYRTVWEFGGGSTGAYVALVFTTIAGLIRKTGIGDIANSVLLEFVKGSKPTLLSAIDRLIKDGFIERISGDGRGNKCTYYITKKGQEFLPFKVENQQKKGKDFLQKGSKILTERVKNFDPLNKDIKKEINKESSSFDVEPQKPKMEEEEKFLKEKINNSDAGLEAQALADVKKIFSNSVGEDARASFQEFWQLFNPAPDQQCKYKVALTEWNDMPENCRNAAITLMRKGARLNNPNPYFFLQHFRETKYFLNDREQYDAYKNGVRLCRVRYKDQQRVMSAVFADAFQMEILDDHYEKRFEV